MMIEINNRTYYYRKISQEEIVYCVFDLETGGFDPVKNGICQIACLFLDKNLNEVARYRDLIYEEDREYKKEALDINNLTMDFITEKGTPQILALRTWKRFFQPDFIYVCHNAKFDCSFMNARGFNIKKAIDTMILSKTLWKGQSGKLEDVSKRIGIKVENAHDALGDVLMTAEILKYIFSKMKNIRPRDIDFNWKPNPRYNQGKIIN